VTSPGPRDAAFVTRVRRKPATACVLCDDRRSWMSRRQARVHPWAHSASGLVGSQPSAAGLRPRLSWHPSRGTSQDVSGSVCTGNRAIRWCSGRESVAEVGETHLSRRIVRSDVLETARRSSGGVEVARGDPADL